MCVAVWDSRHGHERSGHYLHIRLRYQYKQVPRLPLERWEGKKEIRTKITGSGDQDGRYGAHKQRQQPCYLGILAPYYN